MRGADGIWSLGGNFWGEAGRGKNAAGARAQVCVCFFFVKKNAGVAFMMAPFTGTSRQN